MTVSQEQKARDQPVPLPKAPKVHKWTYKPPQKEEWNGQPTTAEGEEPEPPPVDPEAERRQREATAKTKEIKLKWPMKNMLPPEMRSTEPRFYHQDKILKEGEFLLYASG